MIISKDNVARLRINAELSTLQDNSYLRDESNENYKYIVNKFFLGQEEKMKTLNSGTGLFGTICNTFGNYTGSPEYDIKIDINEATKDLVTYGFATVSLAFKQTKEGPTPYLVHLPAYGYFRQNSTDHILRVYKKVKEYNTIEYYIYIQSFYPGYTENKLYTSLGSVIDFEQLKEVQLDTIEETIDKQPSQKHPRKDRTSLFVIRRDENEIYPNTSEILEARDLVYAMDRKKIMFDCEFLKNVESFVLFKNIEFPERVQNKRKGTVPMNMQDFGKFIEGGDDSSIEFINNTNTLIKDAMESQKDDMRIFSTKTSIPLDFLGMDTAHGSLGKGSRGLLHGAFAKKIEHIRAIRDEYLPDIIEAFQSIKTMENDNYTRPDIFARSDMELLEESVMAKDANITSHKRAIMTYMGYTEEQAQEEILAIIEEKKLLQSIVSDASETTPGDEGDKGEDTKEDTTA